MIIEVKNPPEGMPREIEVKPEPKIGGEGAIYFSTDGKYAVKTYLRPKNDRERHLTDIMKLFRDLRTEQQRFIVPPLALISKVDGESKVGFVMRAVPTNYREVIEAVLTPAHAKRQYEKGKRWHDFLKIARDIANSMVVLHGKGCAHGDVHYRNFLSDLDAGDAVILEMDGVIVPGFLPAGVKGMAGFMAPEILTRNAAPDLYTDRYSLSVLILHILLLRNVMNPLVEYDDDADRSERLGWGEFALFSEHPNDARHRPENLGTPLYRHGALSYEMLTPGLQRLAEQALIIGLNNPSARPLAKQWEEELAFAFDSLWTCRACTQTYPYPYWRDEPDRKCPFCGALAEGAAVLLELFEERWLTDFRSISRTLVLSSGAQLFADVAMSGRKPPLKRQSEPAIGHVEWDDQRGIFHLINDEGGCWVAKSLLGETGHQARKGELLPLREGYFFISATASGSPSWTWRASPPRSERRQQDSNAREGNKASSTTVA